jgi:hypothetical protein
MKDGAEICQELDGILSYFGGTKKLQAAVELSEAASQSLARCLALLNIAVRGQCGSSRRQKIWRAS